MALSIGERIAREATKRWRGEDGNAKAVVYRWVTEGLGRVFWKPRGEYKDSWKAEVQGVAEQVVRELSASLKGCILRCVTEMEEAGVIGRVEAGAAVGEADSDSEAPPIKKGALLAKAVAMLDELQSNPDLPAAQRASVLQTLIRFVDQTESPPITLITEDFTEAWPEYQKETAEKLDELVQQNLKRLTGGSAKVLNVEE